jgi:hypothetical protein
MIKVVPINNAKALEVRKWSHGSRVELKADFGQGIITKARPFVADLQKCLLLDPGKYQDFNGQLRRVNKLKTGELRLFFAPNEHNDLVVVNSSELAAALDLI